MSVNRWKWITEKMILLLFLILMCPIIGNAQFWVPTNGPYGGHVYSFAESKQGDLYVATRGGVFRSTDQGDHWSETALNNKNVFAVAVDSSGIIFAGTDYFGVLRSTDKELTWEQMNTGFPDPPPVVTFLLSTPDGNLFSCTSSGLYRYTSSGGAWSRLFSGLVQVIAIDSNGYLFLARYDDGIYRSKDSGVTWTKHVSAFGSYTGLSINKTDIFASIYRVGGPGVLRSTDGGNSWAEVNNGLTTDEIRALTISSSGEIFAGTRKGVFRSTNKGDNWNASGMVDTLILSLFSGSAGDVFAGTVGDGLVRTTDHGATWIKINQGLKATIVQTLLANSTGDIFAGTSSEGIYHSTDKGNKWTQINLGLANKPIWALASGADGDIFAGTDLGLFRWTNNGSQWTQVYSSMTHPEVRSICIASRGEIFIGVGLYMSGNIVLFRGKILRSINNGNSWEDVSQSLPDRMINAIVMDKEGNLFVALQDSGVYRSSDYGNNWEPTPLKRTVFSLALDSSGNIFAGSLLNGVFLSTDQGESWSSLGGPISDQVVRSIKINTVNHIYVGTDSAGIYRSMNGGNSWGRLNDGFVNRNIYAITFDRNGYAFVGTSGSGVFRSANPTTNISEEPRTPSLYVLHQNYPNPFNPTTTIQFDLPKKSYVEITVYDLLGRKITTLVKEVMQAGTHRSTLNAAGLPSGLYVCIMRADKFLQARTMLLLK